MFIGPVMIWKICEDRTTCWEFRNLPQDKWAEPTFQAQVHCSFYQDTNCKSSFQLSRVLLGQADFSGDAVAGGLGGGRWLLVATGWRELDLIIPSGELLRFTVTAAVHGVQIMSGLSVWRKRGKNHMNSQGSSWEVGSITSKERIHTCRGQRRTTLGKQEPRTLANFGKKYSLRVHVVLSPVTGPQAPTHQFTKEIMKLIYNVEIFTMSLLSALKPKPKYYQEELLWKGFMY